MKLERYGINRLRGTDECGDRGNDVVCITTLGGPASVSYGKIRVIFDTLRAAHAAQSFAAELCVYPFEDEARREGAALANHGKQRL